MIGNLLWWFFGGLEAAFGYFTGSLAMAITIIGLPVAWQTFKIGLLCLWPFGSEVRSNLMLSGIANVALIPRILDVGSLRGFYEDKLQSLHFAQFIPMNSALMT